MDSILTPREVVSELDKYIIGQEQAKRMVAVALRNRWRRQQLDPTMRDEVAPKNIIMMGPTGVGKTEIARRLAKLSASPFLKIEATKFTEVGYVGRDVEAMIRDLMEISVNMVREEENKRVQAQAETGAEERLLDLLLPSSTSSASDSQPASIKPESTRDKLRTLWRQGALEHREVEMEVTVPAGPQMDVMTMPGMEEWGSQIKDMFSKAFPTKSKRRRMKLREAYEILLQEESDRLIEHDKVVELARERTEQTGIIFLDEIDKIAASPQGGKSADISREGVQRDLLPIVEGSAVTTKYGIVHTDHILFIGAGAFHYSKPSDLIPELQGRFPLRVELSALGQKEFLRILTEPKNALTIQYKALLATEGVTVEYTDDALDAVAHFAQEANQETENIGARRLYTIMEKILSDLSFEAPDRNGDRVVVDSEYVRQHLADVTANKDLTRYIL